MRKLLFLILFPILLCSCIEVYWLNPVSDIQNAVVDEELIGTWVGCMKMSSEGKTYTYLAYFHIGKMDGKRMKLISQLIHPGSIEEKTEIVEEGTEIMHISRLDGRRFMNIRESEPNAEMANRYYIMEYEIKERDTLILRHVNPDFVDNAIRNQVLLGKGTLVLSDSSEIRKFIRNSPREQVFPTKLKFDEMEIEYCSFKRLKF